MTNDIFDNWQTQLRKGLLELCVLNAIGRGRLYGYDIVRRLREIEGLVISEGTIYPILSRFKRDGLVMTSLEESAEGPARKYYELTPPGRDLLGRMNAMWSTIVTGVKGIQTERNEK